MTRNGHSYLSTLHHSRQNGKIGAILKKRRHWKKHSPMKELTLTRQKIENILAGLLVLSKPHPQTTADGKTVTRDFEIPPKARFLLLENMTSLKELSDAKEAKRMRLVQCFLPNGEQGASSEKLGEFQKEFLRLMEEEVKVQVYQVYISDEATTAPDTIDLTKAPIPISALVDLNRTILIAKNGCLGSSEKPTPTVVAP